MHTCYTYPWAHVRGGTQSICMRVHTREQQSGEGCRGEIHSFPKMGSVCGAGGDFQLDKSLRVGHHIHPPILSSYLGLLTSISILTQI